MVQFQLRFNELDQVGNDPVVWYSKCVQQRYLMSRVEANISNNASFPILFSTHLVQELTKAWSYGEIDRSCMSAHSSSPNFGTCFVLKCTKLNKSEQNCDLMGVHENFETKKNKNCVSIAFQNTQELYDPIITSKVLLKTKLGNLKKFQRFSSRTKTQDPCQILGFPRILGF